MNQKRRNGSRVIAALLLFSIAQISLQVGLAEPNNTTNSTAIPQQLIGRLTTRNNQPVMVNGLSATTGASIVSGATIETGADQSATVNVGSLGSVDIAPNTKLILTFDEQNLKAVIINGCATVSAKKKTTGEIANEQGSLKKTEPGAGGVLKVCFPETAGKPTNVGHHGGPFGLGTLATILIFSSYGAEVALVPLIFQINPSHSAP
jgi:hypothetical protein